MKFPSPSPTRRGFTLLELVIAMGIGSVVMALVANAYLGANKAQGMSVGTNALKSAGQIALNDMYETLHGAHTIFSRNGLAYTYMTQRLPIDGYDASATRVTPGVTAGDIQLPAIMANPSFWDVDASGVPNPNASDMRSAVGNCLFFTAREPDAVMLEEGTGTELQATFGTPEYHIGAYRYHFYFLSRRPVAVGGKAMMPGVSFTFQLMHWKSGLYLDYQALAAWMNRLKDAGVANSYIDLKLTRLSSALPGFEPIVGAVDLDAPDPSPAASPAALYTLSPTSSPDHRALTPYAGRLKTKDYRSAAWTSLKGGFGESMVCFNTDGPAWMPKFPVAGMKVPMFADFNTSVPYGLEVLVGGDPSARQVLLRLALAARTQPGNVLMGQSFQQVVHISATTMDSPALASTPTPAPTPTPTAPPSSGGGGY